MTARDPMTHEDFEELFAHTSRMRALALALQTFGGLLTPQINAEFLRVSLRLDPQRHLRLRLLAAHAEMSLQETLIAGGLALDTLSMGMSADLEAAIAEGAS